MTPVEREMIERRIERLREEVEKLAELLEPPEDYEPCRVADSNYCEAPPHATTSETPKTQCYVCGLRVCEVCSVVVEYHKSGKRRLCHTCLEEYDEDDERVLTHLGIVAQAFVGQRP